MSLRIGITVERDTDNSYDIPDLDISQSQDGIRLEPRNPFRAIVVDHDDLLAAIWTVRKQIKKGVKNGESD